MRLLVVWIAVMVLIAATGCQPVASRPISTSLQDLLVESTPIKGPILEHHEVFSIAGLLPMPDVGVFYHYPVHQRFPFWGRTIPPSAAIGINRSKSCRLTGTIGETVSCSDVDAIVDKIVDVQTKARVAAQLIVKKAVIEASLAKIDRRLEAKPEDAALRTRKSTIESQASDMQTKINDAEAAVDRATDALRTVLTSKTGVVVAEWTVKRQKQGNVQAGGLATLSGSRDEERSGFVVLGGVRIQHLYLGDDIKDLFLNLQEEDRRAVTAAGLTTYLLQAKCLRYVNDFDLQSIIRAEFEFSREELGAIDDLLEKLDKIRIAALVAAVSQLHNQGSLGGMKWACDEVKLGRDLHDRFAGDAGGVDGWMTVQAMVTSGDRLFKNWQSSLAKREPIQLRKIPHIPQSQFGRRIDDHNQWVVRLQATLATDLAYQAKRQVTDALHDLNTATETVGVALGRPIDPASVISVDFYLSEATNRLRLVLNKLKVRDEQDNSLGWSGLDVQSEMGKDILEDLIVAADSLRLVGSIVGVEAPVLRSLHRND